MLYVPFVYGNARMFLIAIEGDFVAVTLCAQLGFGVANPYFSFLADPPPQRVPPSTFANNTSRVVARILNTALQNLNLIRIERKGSRLGARSMPLQTDVEEIVSRTQEPWTYQINLHCMGQGHSHPELEVPSLFRFSNPSPRKGSLAK